MNEQELKKQIMDNKPTARLNENGEIELEFNENFYNVLDNYVDEKKAEVKRKAFQVAILTVLGISTSARSRIFGTTPQVESEIWR